ncbi:MAG TPA: hypothetical protein VM658_12290 [bacterium]|nr:hypothetical protein [bacterium]
MRKFAGIFFGMGLAVAAAAAVLWPGLTAWFVADDFVHLGYMRFLDQPWRFWFHPVLGTMIFRPLSFTAMFYGGFFFGLTPWAIHFTDLMNHCLNVALVFILAYRLFPDEGGSVAAPERAGSGGGPYIPATAAALIFAVHPVAALTATWFACRADLMATTFSLTALIIVAGRDKPSAFSLLATFLLGLAAALCKVTHLTLFLAVFFLALLTRRSGRPREKLRHAAATALPVFCAALVFLCWNLLVLGGLGGYGAVPPGVSGLYYQAVYHLPRVWSAGVLDFLPHRMDRGNPLFKPLGWAGAALIITGGWGALRRQWRMLLLGCLFILAMLLPAWNLSHMFAYREERLLYFPLVGFGLIIGALTAGPKRPFLRAAPLMAVLCATLFYGSYSMIAVEDWRAGAAANEKLAHKIADYIEEQGTTSNIRRIYILGLSSEHYYLDMMVKMVLAPAFDDRQVMVGDRDSFLWGPRSWRGPINQPEGVPASALPRLTSHVTDVKMVMETATPPDLLEASVQDPGAAVLEWDGARLKDITPDLKNDFHRRIILAHRAAYYPYSLPSFSFLKTPMKLDWTMSPGLEINAPLFNGDPYVFTATNNDPYLTSPRLNFQALAAARLEIEIKLPNRPYVPPAEQNGCVMWEGRERPGYEGQRTICFPIKADGKIESYSIDLASNIHWARTGTVTGIRLDPVSYPSTFELYRMEFLPE